ncbi:DUF1564 domain-containing protein [Leptospira kmetyi]|uniref:DUF1564 domain-containing protein n=1 Tax=Leptospira kmetyi TaxID=408139 RepID=A0ABX4N6Z1_9LEPT|nr:DUF1564 domain-containing protein [Leptospira kmetyi]PJZ27867.1 hypothetical protein CH378_20845 [Leptospira kmetyi]PJZ42105.1 hypothetical protein CH370_07590 [Leptospira kmetyi]
MQLIFFDDGQKIQSRLNERKDKVVTLLIPQSFYDGLARKEQLGFGRRISYLLRTYSKFISAYPRLNDTASSTLYQKNEGKLKKLNVRIGTGLWSMLGALAQAHGVSRCYLFNFLLYLDRVGVDDSIVKALKEGVPTFHDVYRYIWQLDLTSNTISRALEFTPNPIKPYISIDYPWDKGITIAQT